MNFKLKLLIVFVFMGLSLYSNEIDNKIATLMRIDSKNKKIINDIMKKYLSEVSDEEIKLSENFYIKADNSEDVFFVSISANIWSGIYLVNVDKREIVSEVIESKLSNRESYYLEDIKFIVDKIGKKYMVVNSVDTPSKHASLLEIDLIPLDLEVLKKDNYKPRVLFTKEYVLMGADEFGDEGIDCRIRNLEDFKIEIEDINKDGYKDIKIDVKENIVDSDRNIVVHKKYLADINGFKEKISENNKLNIYEKMDMLIIASEKDKKMAIKKAEEASKKLKLEYEKYYYSDRLGAAVFVEKSDNYSEMQKGYYIVVILREYSGRISICSEVKKIYKNCYIKTVRICIGSKK